MTELKITPEALLNNLEMHRKLAEDAADEIERLRTENKKLRAALKPFADTGECESASFSYSYLRAAAAALKETGNVG